MDKFRVYEIPVKCYLLKNIKENEQHTKIAELIDKTLCRDPKYLQFHKSREFKNYNFNFLYPLEKEEYKEGKIYTFIFRTIDKELMEYIKKYLVNEYTEFIKVLTLEIRIIPKRLIEKIYSITPIIVKTENGYWRKNLSLEEFEERIKINLVKKYNDYFETKINEKFLLYDNIAFHNKKPISVPYKNIHLLGDKLTLHISNDEISQELAYFALGSGLCEANSRGFGYVNYKWY
ncbi:CRISPR-associated endoribonuclease Cas6 [Clostridiaceae bacterium 14S0207]|nr:CRISPR-associated endoribonuclease Cas6 [Clostridiaceae bacterium 14S0207]